MGRIPEDYIQKVYAGWLGKIIGIRHGFNVETWSCEQIRMAYGEITDYLVDYKDFAASDDLNGAAFFVRALEDYTFTSAITAEQIGLTVLNYVPYEHGFFAWTGYGYGTEHTAYLNLTEGIMAPRSGSVEQNGSTMAEAIGGQIFIEPWGLVIPADPKLAAEYAQKAASVTHGGNGVYGGMFIAACVSAAFVENNVEKIIEAGLSSIPEDCEYAKAVREIIEFYHDHPTEWRECLYFAKDNFGYHRYPGAWPIISNCTTVILSLLYGKGDFSRALNISVMCGEDTDCNASAVGSIMGVCNGLDGIDYRWRKPINDFLACSSVMGSLNIMDIPQFATYVANLGYEIANEAPPTKWKDILKGESARFHFEFPGSTHGFRVSIRNRGKLIKTAYRLEHTTGVSHSGKGALKLIAKPVRGGYEVRVFHKTYYRPQDFHDSSHDPSFSPILYPGQKIESYVMVPENIGPEVRACLYVKDRNTETYIESGKIDLIRGQWNKLSFQIPRLEGVCLEEAGVKFIPLKYIHGDYHAGNQGQGGFTLLAYLDDLDFWGEPNYTVDFSKECMEEWRRLHVEVSQFSYLKGIWGLENGELSGSCNDYGEAYTGGYDWKDYVFEATIMPKLGEYHNINFRVQGAIRSYAVGLAPGEKLVLYKNENGYRDLSEVKFPWECGKKYTLRIEIVGPKIRIISADRLLIDYNDEDNPYLRGQIGVSIQNGSHCHYKDFRISPIK